MTKKFVPVIGPFASLGGCHEMNTEEGDEVIVTKPYGGEVGAEMQPKLCFITWKL